MLFADKYSTFYRVVDITSGIALNSSKVKTGIRYTKTYANFIPSWLFLCIYSWVAHGSARFFTPFITAGRFFTNVTPDSSQAFAAALLLSCCTCFPKFLPALTWLILFIASYRNIPMQIILTLKRFVNLVAFFIQRPTSRPASFLFHILWSIRFSHAVSSHYPYHSKNSFALKEDLLSHVRFQH